MQCLLSRIQSTICVSFTIFFVIETCCKEQHSEKKKKKKKKKKLTLKLSTTPFLILFLNTFMSFRLIIAANNPVVSFLKRHQADNKSNRSKYFKRYVTVYFFYLNGYAYLFFF
jgi:hypothetical protein